MENQISVEKVSAGYLINRYGKYGTMRFFQIDNKEELQTLINLLQGLLDDR